MLTPLDFVHKEDRLLELYRGLEDFILEDTARRMIAAGSLTATADRQVYKLLQLGKSREAILERLQALTGESRAELKRLLQEAVLTSWADDAATLEEMEISAASPLENEAVRSVMEAEYQKTRGELENLTRTTADQAQRDLMNLMDEAELRVASGTQSYSAAVNQVLDEYAGRGVYVDYPTGTRRSLEAAVRCCVVTSMNQTSAQVTNQYITEGGCELVLVSAHLGARVKGKNQPELAGHDRWQGRVYRIRGSEPGYPNLLETTGYDIDPETGEGRVVNPLGLHGYNCRHSHKPWDKRLRNPYLDENGDLTIDTEENRQRYRLEQRQRAMERAIRQTRRQLQVKALELEADPENADLQAEYSALENRLSRQDEAYNQFCQENGLTAQYDRLRVADREKTVASSGETGIIKLGNNSVTISSIDSPIEQRNTSRGKPGAILHFDVELNTRQQALLDSLQEYDSRVTISKSDVNMTDLSALTAKTGDEFAMFTKGGDRLIVRGNSVMVNITLEEARELAAAGYTWSGHTHPGTGTSCLIPSSGDKSVLACFDQPSSCIYNSVGDYYVFWKE
ncbi:MAG: phage minor capsid protein [Clostridiales bacterium]|nr:phage minor capsid protein [Clostridiales bacterium]